jgi:esterase/lipase
MFEIKPCKDKGGISVKPKKSIKLDLSKIKNNFEVVVDTPILIVIKKEDEIIVHNYGELIFKHLKDKEKIKKIAEEIYKVGEKN